MKRLLCAVASVLLAVSGAWAGGSEPIHLSTTVLTNSATLQVSNMSTSDAVVYGCVEYVYIDLGGYTSPTVRVDVVTASGRTVPSRTLLSSTALTADAAYAPRVLSSSTAAAAATDSYESIPLYNDKLVLHAYNANVTNAITVDAYIFIENE